FNTWRPLVFILFLKTIWRFRNEIFGAGREIIGQAKNSLIGGVKFVYQNYKIEFLSFLLFAVAVFSLLKAQDFIFGARRLVYFANLGMLFFAARAVVKKENLAEFSKNIIISGAIIAVAGAAQLVSSYLMTIDDFAEFWALTVQQNLYGKAWAYIVISANTWFAYYQDTIHLRVFSFFPDTHSFPLYLLIVSSFVLSLILRAKFIIGKNYFWFLAFLNLFTACLILSGTRGIWASIVFPAAFSVWVLFNDFETKKYARFLFLPIMLFFLLLPLAALVYTSSQFKSPETESEKNIFTERLKSIIDAGETSNSGRIFIWKETLKSIAREPLLGVGLGNFPVVLKEDVALLKAGASAHNLYLNILAEIGIFGF
ncbi:MAG: O-antigen ligase family protein, partial [Patescibacteria group bacterium]